MRQTVFVQSAAPQHLDLKRIRPGCKPGQPHRLQIFKPEASKIWEFPGPYNKDPINLGYYIRVPYFRRPPYPSIHLDDHVISVETAARCSIPRAPLPLPPATPRPMDPKAHGLFIGLKGLLESKSGLSFARFRVVQTLNSCFTMWGR